MKDKPRIYCRNHAVACGSYECPYADTVDNSITCTSRDCCYNSGHIKVLTSSDNSIVVNNYELSLNEEDLVDYPF